MPTSPNISVTLPNDGDSGWGDTLNTAISTIVNDVNALSIPSTSSDLGAGSSVAPVQTASFTASPNYYYPVNAGTGAVIASLPTTSTPGSIITFEREDSTTNSFTISGQIRTSSTATITFTSGQYEAISFISDPNGYWWPSGDKKTRMWMDATYAKTAVISAGAGSVGSSTQIPVITYNADGQITAVTTAANTGSGGSGASNATTSAPGLVQLAGDLGGTSTTAASPVLKSVGTSGTYGSATLVPIVTTDPQGRVTTVTTAAPLDVSKLAKANNLSDLGSTATALTNLGLNNVTNTTDANKPVSTAQAAYISANNFSVTPTVGYIGLPVGFISSAPSTLSSGVLYAYPYYVGSNGYTVDALYCAISTAQSGGSVTFQAAVYGDDGTGWPLGTNQVIAPQSFTMTATGNVSGGTLGTPVALTPGRYWIMTMYTNTTTPTTVPIFACLNNVVWSLPVPTSTVIGTATRGYAWTSQTTFPSATLSRTASFSVSSSGAIPLIGMHRSA